MRAFSKRNKNSGLKTILYRYWWWIVTIPRAFCLELKRVDLWKGTEWNIVLREVRANHERVIGVKIYKLTLLYRNGKLTIFTVLTPRCWGRKQWKENFRWGIVVEVDTTLLLSNTPQRENLLMISPFT